MRSPSLLEGKIVSGRLVARLEEIALTGILWPAMKG